MKENLGFHFFMDEFPVGSNGLKPADLKQLSDELSDDTFLWIACQSQKSPPSKEIEQIGNTFWN